MQELLPGLCFPVNLLVLHLRGCAVFKTCVNETMQPNNQMLNWFVLLVVIRSAFRQFKEPMNIP